MISPNGKYFFKSCSQLCSSEEELTAEYKAFKHCLPQLMDDESMVGDLTGKWVIFANGWLADYTGFDSAPLALTWGEQLHRNDLDTVWIVAKVDLLDHDISPLAMLGDILSDVEFNARPRD